MLLQNAQPTQLDSREFLASLESKDYKLPPKSRDIYLYLPYRMMELIPTIAQFSDIDLESGASVRDRDMYTSKPIKQDGEVVTLENGIKIDTANGTIELKGQKVQAKTIVMASKDTAKNQTQTYDQNGEYSVVYMEQYGDFVVMDSDTFDSVYVQMFMVGNYDKSRFELVISSPYSKIYKLKQ
jgi:dolichyl-diphosphooligosaccharide--protein glycosyltransferase/undecaprenyl-diphosphooligosaccharide--protein glycosyltransferase